jgi:hypothetical protein
MTKTEWTEQFGEHKKLGTSASFREEKVMKVWRK